MITLCVVKTEPHKYVITTTDVRDKNEGWPPEMGKISNRLFRKPDPIDRFVRHSLNEPNEGWMGV